MGTDLVGVSSNQLSALHGSHCWLSSRRRLACWAMHGTADSLPACQISACSADEPMQALTERLRSESECRAWVPGQWKKRRAPSLRAAASSLQAASGAQMQPCCSCPDRFSKAALHGTHWGRTCWLPFGLNRDQSITREGSSLDGPVSSVDCFSAQPSAGWRGLLPGLIRRPGGRHVQSQELQVFANAGAEDLSSMLQRLPPDCLQLLVPGLWLKVLQQHSMSDREALILHHGMIHAARFVLAGCVEPVQAASPQSASCSEA